MKKITKYEAKVLSLEIWQYLAAHSEIDKKGLPTHLFLKVRGMKYDCPLCELYHKPEPPCQECPLESCGIHSHYQDWYSSSLVSVRQKAAQAIVKKIQKWDVKND